MRRIARARESESPRAVFSNRFRQGDSDDRLSHGSIQDYIPLHLRHTTRFCGKKKKGKTRVEPASQIRANSLRATVCHFIPVISNVRLLETILLSFGWTVESKKILLQKLFAQHCIIFLSFVISTCTVQLRNIFVRKSYL